MLVTVAEIVGAFIVVILTSSVVAACVTHHLKRTQAEREYLRGKLEDLYRVVHAYADDWLACSIGWEAVMSGEISFTEKADIFVDKATDVEVSRKRCRDCSMLIHVHFPELLPTFDLLKAAMLSAQETLKDFQTQCGKKEYSSYFLPFLGRYKQQRIAVAASRDVMLDEIAKMGRAIGGERTRKQLVKTIEPLQS